MKENNTDIKKKIYYSRTYRRLRPDTYVQNLYLLLFVLPSLIVFLLSYSNITYYMSRTIQYLLSFVMNEEIMRTGYDQFMPFFGGVFYIHLPGAQPDLKFILINIVVTILLLWFFFSGKRFGHPVSIYFGVALFIHLVSCVFFFFGTSLFPYSATVYSELYVKQQVGIWLCFLLISGLVTALLGTGNVFLRIGTLVGIMAYSFVFGFVRYFVFMYIVSNVSVLYMAALFFALGPFFDFMYLVFIYGMYVEKIIDVYDSDKGRDVWQWS